MSLDLTNYVTAGVTYVLKAHYDQGLDNISQLNDWAGDPNANAGQFNLEDPILRPDAGDIFDLYDNVGDAMLRLDYSTASEVILGSQDSRALRIASASSRIYADDSITIESNRNLILDNTGAHSLVLESYRGTSGYSTIYCDCGTLDFKGDGGSLGNEVMIIPCAEINTNYASDAPAADSHGVQAGVLFFDEVNNYLAITDSSGNYRAVYLDLTPA